MPWVQLLGCISSDGMPGQWQRVLCGAALQAMGLGRRCGMSSRRVQCLEQGAREPHQTTRQGNLHWDQPRRFMLGGCVVLMYSCLPVAVCQSNLLQLLVTAAVCLICCVLRFRTPGSRAEVPLQVWHESCEGAKYGFAADRFQVEGVAQSLQTSHMYLYMHNLYGPGAQQA